MQPLLIVTGSLLAAMLTGLDEPDGKALFLQNCATCHGETGDGKGVTQLDRPARSFRDGGFSYGNTVPAIVRTITNGIPGTPMPAFDASTTTAQRKALAEFVISLGPPGVIVDPADTVMVVKDRPLVVRGFLPPITSGAAQHPRGLLLGTLEGLTFEYAANDMRLLGVRAGEFVERRDWVGRGGDSLKPLGKVVYLVEDGNPRAMFNSWGTDRTDDPLGKMEPLHSQLLATWVRGNEVGLTYKVSKKDVPETEGNILRIEERVQAVGTSVAAGFKRTLTPISGGHSSLVLAIGTLEAGEKILKHNYPNDDGRSELVIQRNDGTIDTLIARTTSEIRNEITIALFVPRPIVDGRTRIDLEWAMLYDTPLSLTVLSGTSYQPGHLETIRSEVAR